MSLGEQEARIIAEFGRHYRIYFHRPELLKLALTHRSYLSVTGQGPRESNERLEFLGDSVLGLVTSEYLYLQHPNEHEGQLTKTKSLLVSKAILSRRGLAMGLGRFVLMSHSEVESGGRQRLSIVADAFEAVVGAIYLDQGFDAARSFIERWLLRDYREIAADKRHTNYKSHLQEYVQSTFRTHPVYRIRSEMGPDHSKQFMVEVMVGRRVLGAGRGRNKKEAEQAAARDALEKVQERPRATAEIEERPRETREGRGAAAPAPGRTPVREAEAGAAPLPGTGEALPDEEGARPAGSRRRRGRRGGRGRRPHGTEEAARPESPEGPAAAVEPEEAEAEDVRPARPAIVRRPKPTREPRLARFRPAPAVPEEELPEIEPLPPASEEDENEEIGRPEGPHEERHVDPYEVEVGSSEPTSHIRTPVEPEDLWPEDREPEEEEEPRGVEPAPAATEPEAEEEVSPGEPRFDREPTEDRPRPGGRPEGTRYGRRPGRTRRGSG